MANPLAQYSGVKRQTTARMRERSTLARQALGVWVSNLLAPVSLVGETPDPLAEQASCSQGAKDQRLLGKR